MRAIQKITSIALFMASQAAFAASCQQTGVWDWYADDFRDFDGRFMDKPWYSDSHIGVSMTNSQMCYENGWRMMARSFKCEDYFTSSLCANGAVSRPGSYKPKFALYNIHTGLVRFFIYVDSAVSQTQKIQVSINLDHGTHSSDYGLLLNDGSESIVYSEKTTAENEAKVLVFPAYGLSETSPKWLIFDKYLSYEPNLNPGEGLQFNIYLDGIEESQLTLDGNFEFTLEDITPVNDRSVLGTAWGAKDDVIKAYSSIAEMGESITSSGYEMYYDIESSENDKSFANSMISFGDLISNNAGPIGAVAAAATLVGAFNNTKEAPTVYYGKGDISLKGSTFSQYGLNHRAIGVPFSDHIEDTNEARLSEENYSQALGLFHFNGKPEVVLRTVSAFENGALKIKGLEGRLITKIEPLITLNPHSEMKLEEVKVTPHIETLGFENTETGVMGLGPVYLKYGLAKGFSANYKDETGKNIYENLPGAKYREQYIESSGDSPIETVYHYKEGQSLGNAHNAYSKTILSGDNFLEDYLSAYWHSAGFGDTPSVSLNDAFIKDVKMKIYLRFQHKSKPDVYAEFVKILDAIEYTCDSASDRAVINTYGRKSTEICNGFSDLDSDGIKDWIEIAYGWDYFDSSNAHFDPDGDGFTNLEEIRKGFDPYSYNNITLECDLSPYKKFKTPFFALKRKFNGNNLHNGLYFDTNISKFQDGNTIEIKSVSKDYNTGAVKNEIITRKVRCDGGKMYDVTFEPYGGSIREIPTCYDGNKDHPLSSGKCGNF